MPRTGHFATGGSVATETVETDQKPSPHKANKKALRASIPQHLKPEELFGRIASEDEVITWKDLRRGVPIAVKDRTGRHGRRRHRGGLGADIAQPLRR